LGKDIFKLGVVSEARHHRRVGGKGMNPERAIASRVGPVKQIRGQVIGIGGTAPVARKKNAGTPFPHTGELFLNSGPGGIGRQGVEPLD
jgi:hypothetical protein